MPPHRRHKQHRRQRHYRKINWVDPPAPIDAPVGKTPLVQVLNEDGVDLVKEVDRIHKLQTKLIADMDRWIGLNPDLAGDITEVKRHLQEVDDAVLGIVTDWEDLERIWNHSP